MVQIWSKSLKIFTGWSFLRSGWAVKIAWSATNPMIRPSEGPYAGRRINESCMNGGCQEAIMQCPRQISEARKRIDSKLCRIQVADPLRSAYYKSCSSDTKLRFTQIIKAIFNPIYWIKQSLTPIDARHERTSISSQSSRTARRYASFLALAIAFLQLWYSPHLYSIAK
jgi:hypothetical protein